MRKKILLVDDNITNLSIGKNALYDTYQVLTVPSGEKALMMLSQVTPDLILLDVEMPDMNGLETLKRIRANPDIPHIPVIFLTAKSDAESELEGLALGAADYITKPFSVPLLKSKIAVHLLLEEQRKLLQDYNDNFHRIIDEKTAKLNQLQEAVLCAVAELAELKDGAAGDHIEKTQQYLTELFTQLSDEFEMISRGDFSC